MTLYAGSTAGPATVQGRLSFGKIRVTETKPRYFLASSSRQGALGIIHAYADESVLAERIDARLLTKSGKPAVVEPLDEKGLHYGWLANINGEMVDEIMLAKPVSGLRVIMIHGGANVRNAVSDLLESLGFSHTHDEGPPLYAMLEKAVTQTQVAVLLDALDKQRAGIPYSVPEQVLATHRVLVAGPPNAGKSSLLNHLAGYHRAFVHEEAGATLDVVDELVDMGGLAVMLGDMPGVRPEQEALEKAAWEKAAGRLALAEAILFVCDSSQEWDAITDHAASMLSGSIPVLVVLNKSDLPSKLEGEPWTRHFSQARAMRVSSLPQGDAATILGKEIWRLLGLVASI